jgi:glutamate N-acetyltransferase/amino-acid N-acetyltransferase
VKSAIHGADPNWGRILARLGAEKVPASALDKMNLEMQGEPLFADGTPLAFDREQVRSLLKTDTVTIEIDLKSGDASATAWGCDLTKRYIDINTEYN